MNEANEMRRRVEDEREIWKTAAELAIAERDRLKQEMLGVRERLVGLLAKVDAALEANG